MTSNLTGLLNAAFPWLLTKRRREQIERETMIRCVNLIDQGAREYYARMTKHVPETEHEELDHWKADAFSRQSGAGPILDELGMTFPDCRSQKGI